MTMHINILSARVSFNFMDNKRAVGALNSTDAVDRDEKNEGSRDHSTSSSDKTMTYEDSEFAQVEKFGWIEGVGDICNVTLREGNDKSGISRRQKIEPGPSSNSPTNLRPGTSMALVNCHGFQNNPNTRRSTLRRHCDFWDTDQDGVIYPWDIFKGFRKLGFNIALCLWAAVTMAICSSYSTQTSYLPHPFFAINLENINRNRHGSTTGAYDLDAELDMRRFDAVFEKYADGKDYLTWRTMYKVWVGQCCANDFFGWFAGGLEWIAMYILLWPQDGKMRKDDIRGVYDGTIFWKIAEARAQAQRLQGDDL